MAPAESSQAGQRSDVAEAVAVFDSWATLQAVTYDLLIAGLGPVYFSLPAIELGGLRLKVRCFTPADERLATKIIEGHSGRDARLHRDGRD